MPEYKEPDWYDRDKLRRIQFASDETGWVVDMGDGTYRLANNPIRGMVGQRVKEIAQWGDLIKIGSHTEENGFLEVIEKYDPEVDRIKE